MDTACFTYEGLPVLINQQPSDYKSPVWILGKQYDGKYEEIENAVKACLWFTYRKGFPAIGGTGPSSDSGWGCMLRSGQMILAEALVRRHLGKDWTWNPREKNIKYMMVLKSFLDKKDSFYSIHQIAQMGVSEGKAIGSWFGPNTVSQVLRKLAQFDEWSKIAVHVAMDNTVVINDIRCLCKSSPNATEKELDTPHEKESDIESTVRNRRHNQSACSDTLKTDEPIWKPLVLFIPLRLGLSTMNMVYENALKKCFSVTQSLGCIGGKPNHASYFIGYYGSKLLYLDPHVTQNAILPESFSDICDETYHCDISPPLSINISAIDPSLALGFYCDTESEFNELCVSLKEINKSSSRPVFEIIDERPAHWPPYEMPTQPNVDMEKIDERQKILNDLSLGDIFQEMEQYENAIKSYQKAIDIGKKSEDEEMQIVASQKLGRLYLTLASISSKDGDYDKATKCYQKAFIISGTEPINNQLGEQALNGLEEAWRNLRSKTKASHSSEEPKEVDPERPQSWKWEKNSILHREKFVKLQKYGRIHPKEIKVINDVRVCFSNEFLIGRGSDATRVYVGLGRDGYERAVKRLARDDCAFLAEQEKKILNEPNAIQSKYVVRYRYLDDKSDKDWIFLIMDLCEETLNQYVERSSLEGWTKIARIIIEQVLSGLADLHCGANRILHRDLKPSNILRDVHDKWLLADFGISRILTNDVNTFRSKQRGTKDWRAVESCSSKGVSDDAEVRYKRESDIQVAGMVVFYIVTKGAHPFGEEPDRQRNILDGNPVYLNKLEDPAAKDLISWMLNHDPKDRPTAEEALKHPYLQLKEKQFELLYKMGNQPEIKTGDKNSNVVRKLNSDPEDWKTLIEPDVLNYLCIDFVNGKSKTFNYNSSWTECLRLIRNVNQHWHDRPRPLPQPEPYYIVDDPKEYFLKIFPNLAVLVHRIVRSCDWKERPELKEYFS